MSFSAIVTLHETQLSAEDCPFPQITAFRKSTHACVHGCCSDIANVWWMTTKKAAKRQFFFCKGVHSGRNSWICMWDGVNEQKKYPSTILECHPKVDSRKSCLQRVLRYRKGSRDLILFLVPSNWTRMNDRMTKNLTQQKCIREFSQNYSS